MFLFCALISFLVDSLSVLFVNPSKLSHNCTGCPEKNVPQFCLISPATNMLEGWKIFHLNGGIHRSVWSTKTFLCDIREPRYKQIKMGYQISEVLYIGQSSALKSDVQYCLLKLLKGLLFKSSGKGHGTIVLCAI